MKILRIFLYETNEDQIIKDLYSFNECIDKLTKDLTNKSLCINTYCLAALDFNYFDIFDQIIVYDKSKYIIFERGENNIINVNSYDYNGNKVTVTDKEIRYAHNLYKLVVHGHFNLDNKKEG